MNFFIYFFFKMCTDKSFRL